MSELGYLIKTLAGNQDNESTFPAIVVDNKVPDNQGNFLISAMILGDRTSFEEIQARMKSGEVMGAETEIIHQIRLRAAINSINEGVICVPRIGSWVLVSVIENNTARAFVSQYSEVDQFIIRMRKPDADGEFSDIVVTPEKMSINFGGLFSSTITKEALNINFLKPIGNEDDQDTDQSALASLEMTKQAMKLAFFDDDENMLSNAAMTGQSMDFKVVDGCEASIAKSSAVVSTNGDKNIIKVDETEGIQLKSDKLISIEGDQVLIKATKDVTVSGTDINLDPSS
ncbi:MAG: hypothetical protein AAFQ94_14375 [Bacteroidota bacterium]